MEPTGTRDDWVFGIAGLATGLGVIAMALFPLAIPIAALTVLVLLPLAVPLLALAAVLAATAAIFTAAWRGIRDFGRSTERPGRAEVPLRRARACRGCA
jgi:hypothetical protein